MSEAGPVAIARASNGQRIAVLALLLAPLLGLVAAIALLWGRGVGWIELGVLAGMYLGCGLGITVGFHRLFTHRSFETVRPIRLLLGVLGSMSVQGPLLKWSAVHRRHHQHSDRAADPHTPHGHGDGLRGALAGFWHAHAGWMFAADPPDLGRYVRDLSDDAMTRNVDRCFVVWVALGLLLPAVLGGLLTGTATGAGLGFLWGGLVRIFLLNHMTWGVNSVCHLWGGRPFGDRDESRNNFLLGIFALGEGWHHNHHTFPMSARHGFRWWQIDVSYLTIRLLELTGLAWRVRRPSRAALAPVRRPFPAQLDVRIQCVIPARSEN